jgi:hypothetical protein
MTLQLPAGTPVYCAMSFMITPGQLSRRAEFYYQLAQLTAAGLGLIGALQQLERSPPARSYRQPIRHLLAGLAEGCSMSDALGQLPRPWLPAFDAALLQAGERSGRLDACFRLLAEYYADRARVARQLISDLMYPVFLLHFAVFILPFPQLFLPGGDLAKYACRLWACWFRFTRPLGWPSMPGKAGTVRGGAGCWSECCTRFPCWERPGVVWPWGDCPRRWKRCSAPGSP